MPARNRKSVFGHAMGTAATITGATFFSAVLAAGACLAADKPELKDAKDKVNYSVGYQVGGDFKQQGVALNADALVQGIRDAMSGAEPVIGRKEMSATLVELKKKMDASERKTRKERVAAVRPTGAVWTPINCWRCGDTLTVPKGRPVWPAVAAAEGGAPSAYTGSSCMPQSGAVPGLSDR